ELSSCSARRYREWACRCPECARNVRRSGHCSPRRLVPFVALFAALIFFLVFGQRHDIDAGEPAVQIDVSAPLGAERPQHGIGGLSADWAFAPHWFGGFNAGHKRNMGNSESRASGSAE